MYFLSSRPPSVFNTDSIFGNVIVTKLCPPAAGTNNLLTCRGVNSSSKNQLNSGEALEDMRLLHKSEKAVHVLLILKLTLITL